MKKLILLSCLTVCFWNYCSAISITLLDSMIDDKCTNNSLMVHFNKQGTYNSGNTFRVQLSDNNGNFNSAVVIGSKSATGSGIDSIKCSFPANAQGSDYRIRVLSSNVADTSRPSLIFGIAYMPKVMFDANDSTQCQANHEFIFTNKTDSTTTFVLQFWMFGDDSFSISNSPRYKYRAPGKYRVTLFVFTLGNCFDSATQNMTVFASPALGFSTNIDSQCFRNHRFIYRDTSKRTINYTRKWDISDPSSYTDSIVNKTYSKPGLYTVRLTIVTPGGCRDSVTHNSRVYASPPKAGFTLDKPAECLKSNNFKFTDTTNTTIVPYIRNWAFDDGTNSSIANPAKHYNTAGIYNPSLIIVTTDGCMDTSSTTQLEVYAGPIAALTIDSGSNCEKSNRIIFRSTSSISSGTFVPRWFFSDGTSSVKDTVMKKFNSSGAFTVRLIAVSNRGCADTADGKSVIWPSPTAGFAINKAEQCIRNNRFNFSSQSTISSGFLSFNWNFGDNSNISIQGNTNHSYASVDSFKVRLMVNSTKNCRDTIIKTIYVRPQPQAVFNITNSPQCLKGNLFNFNNTSQLSTGTYTSKWRFGNGDSSLQKSPQYSYGAAGIYNVTLMINSNYNCGDTVLSSATVHANPTVSISVPGGDSVLCLGDSVSLQALGATTFLWSDNSINAIVKVKTSGKWTVTGTDINGCKDTSAPVNIVVHPLPAKPVLIKTGKDSLRASTTSGNQWYKGSTLLNGATGQYYHYTSKGAYHVVHTDAKGCRSVSDSMVITSLSDILSFNVMKPLIYPNPVNSNLNIQFPGMYSGTLQIVNAFGQVIREVCMDEQSETVISMEELKSGVYFIRMDNSAWKIVKM